MHPNPEDIKTIIIISADIEWQTIGILFPDAIKHASPYGEWFITSITDPVIFFHGGWGKISAAASTQYIIDRWNPSLLINLGTCGGFEGEIDRGTIILVEKTIVYDIIGQMGDYQEHIRRYTTDIDLSWLNQKYPQPVKRTLLVSGDRDILANDIPDLKTQYGAVAGDWESGAIAFVATRNGVPLLILRGVSDLVGESGGEAYGNIQLFEEATGQILRNLVESLPGWIQASRSLYST